MIPALMSCSGPAVSTSTKPDVMDATVQARCFEVGQPWLFDPAGMQTELPDGYAGCAGRPWRARAPGTRR